MAIPPPEPPRPPAAGPGDWVRRNLFRSPVDAVVTLVSGAVVGYVAYRSPRFVFVTGRWDIVRVNLGCSWSAATPSTSCGGSRVALIVAAFVGGLIAGLVAPSTGPHRAGRAGRAGAVVAPRPRTASCACGHCSSAWCCSCCCSSTSRAVADRPGDDRRPASSGGLVGGAPARALDARGSWPPWWWSPPSWCGSSRVPLAVGRLERADAQPLPRRRRRSRCASRSACCSPSGGLPGAAWAAPSTPRSRRSSWRCSRSCCTSCSPAAARSCPGPR